VPENKLKEVVRRNLPGVFDQSHPRLQHKIKEKMSIERREFSYRKEALNLIDRFQQYIVEQNHSD
jgi:hypothetical protein